MAKVVLLPRNTKRPSRKKAKASLPLVLPFIPPPTRDHFKDEEQHVPRNQTTAFTLTDRITHGDAKISQIARLYQLPLLQQAIEDYMERQSEGGVPLELIDCWDRIRLQLRSKDVAGRDRPLNPPIPVMAVVPNKDLPFGFCNFVLVQNNPALNLACFRGEWQLEVQYISANVLSSVTRPLCRTTTPRISTVVLR